MFNLSLNLQQRKKTIQNQESTRNLISSLD
jgi:hypothetical protein